MSTDATDFSEQSQVHYKYLQIYTVIKLASFQKVQVIFVVLHMRSLHLILGILKCSLLHENKYKGGKTAA